MSVPSHRVLSADARADAARSRLEETLAQLRERLAPGTLVNRAGGALRDRGQQAAETGVRAASRHPGAAVAAAAAVMLLLVRKPLARAFRRRG